MLYMGVTSYKTSTGRGGSSNLLCSGPTFRKYRCCRLARWGDGIGVQLPTRGLVHGKILIRPPPPSRLSYFNLRSKLYWVKCYWDGWSKFCITVSIHYTSLDICEWQMFTYLFHFNVFLLYRWEFQNVHTILLARGSSVCGNTVSRSEIRQIIWNI